VSEPERCDMDQFVDEPNGVPYNRPINDFDYLQASKMYVGKLVEKYSSTRGIQFHHYSLGVFQNIS
jgi:hypothetical protein